MAPDPSSLAGMVLAQAGCERCPLHRQGPVPVSTPLTSDGRMLVVMDSPLGDPVSARHDARYRRLCRAVPEMRLASATYVVNCRRDPGQDITTRSRDACSVHRRIELATLQPRLVVVVGDEPCRLYLGRNLDEAAGGAWPHVSGAIVVPLPDEPGPLDETARQLLAAQMGLAA